MQAVDTPDVGTGSGYGAVDPNQAEQEKKEGCAKQHPRLLLGVILLGVVGIVIGLLVKFAWAEDEPEWKQFVEYQKSFSKSYSKSEVQERFQAFKESLVEIARLRDLSLGTATFGWNQFSDLTPQEFADGYLNPELAGADDDQVENSGLQSNLGDSPSVTSLNLTDQGYITPVRNQGGCGSCWAFACTGVIEMNYIQAQGLSGDDVESLRFSEQQVVSCDDVNYGCMGGWPVDAFKYIKNAGGMVTEDDYPYKGSTGSCDGNLDNLVDGTQPQEIDYGSYCGEWRDCSDDVDEEALAASVETNGAHVVAVNASPWQYYTGGILDAETCNESGNGRRTLNHAVILTGFDISGDEKYWSIKNSWSTSWGDNGYINLEYGQNSCGVGNDAIFVNL